MHRELYNQKVSCECSLLTKQKIQPKKVKYMRPETITELKRLRRGIKDGRTLGQCWATHVVREQYRPLIANHWLHYLYNLEAASQTCKKLAPRCSRNIICSVSDHTSRHDIAKWESHNHYPTVMHYINYLSVYTISRDRKTVLYHSVGSPNKRVTLPGQWSFNVEGDSLNLTNSHLKNELHLVGSDLLNNSVKQLLAIAVASNREKIRSDRLEAARNEQLKHIWVSVDSSLRSGNCAAGTAEFIDLHHIDIDSIGALRADYLLSLENSMYTQRAVNYALANGH